MLMELGIATLIIVIVGASVYVIKKRRKEEEMTYVDGSSLTYDDVYPPLTTLPIGPPTSDPPVIEEKLKKAKRKAVAKPKAAPKKRGRPAKKGKK